MAKALATLAEWPFRLGLVRHLEDDPEAQAKESNRINALWMKTLPPVPPMMQEQPASGQMWNPQDTTGMTNTFETPPQNVQASVPTSMQQPAPQMPADMMGALGG